MANANSGQMSELSLQQVAHGWGVELIEPATSGFNDVWFAMRGTEHVVVKRGDSKARVREAATLRSYCAGASRLLAHDKPTGTLLVERILLGDDLMPLSVTDDDAATTVIGTLISVLQGDQLRDGDGELPQLRTLAEVFDAKPDPRLPRTLVEQARRTFDDLMVTPSEVVLHGDLHHTNVVRRGFGDVSDMWVAIDPHGWLGDPVFDTASMLANPRGLNSAESADIAHVIERVERRVEILSEVTGFDRDRIRAWAFTAAVIAELWMLDDHNMVHGTPLALAHALAPRV